MLFRFAMRRLALYACMLWVVACQPASAPSGVRTASGQKSPELWSDWAQWVEKRHSVGDGQGHGPDVGSMEWAHALHYQLKIKDKPGDSLDIGSLQWRKSVEKALSGSR